MRCVLAEGGEGGCRSLVLGAVYTDRRRNGGHSFTFMRVDVAGGSLVAGVDEVDELLDTAEERGSRRCRSSRRRGCGATASCVG